jgi:hypothetical protein
MIASSPNATPPAIWPKPQAPSTGHIVYSTRSTGTSVPPHFNDPKPEITISREITISTPFQRPQAHPARRDPRRHNEQKLTVPDPQAAGMRHRPNFGKRKQLMASKPCIHVPSSHALHITCASHTSYAHQAYVPTHELASAIQRVPLHVECTSFCTSDLAE